MADTEELADLIARLSPEEATTEEALRVASVHAAERLREEMPSIKASIRVHPDTPFVRKSEIVRVAAKRARELRNDWLKANGAYARG